MKWKKKFKLLFDRERIIDFGPIHKTSIDLRKLDFSTERQVLFPLKQLGQEILSMPKFWILLLTLAKQENCLRERGLAELAIYGVENSCDNRILMSDFLPEDVDCEEV